MKKTEILRSLIVAGIFATLLVPFISFNNLYFPFITSKAYVFRVLVEVIFGAWIALSIVDKKYRVKNSLVLWSVVTFLVLLFISNTQGLNPFYSFWSNFERMEGFITLLHIFAYFLVIGSVFQTKKIWNTFLHSVLGVSLIQAFYSFAQAGGNVKVSMTAERVDGTLGNAIYLAAFMLLSLFITLYLLVTKNKKDSTIYFYIVTMILQTITIFLTATRGTIFALVGGLFVAMILLAILEPKKKTLRYGLVGFFVAVAIFASSIVFFKDSSFVQNTESLRRMTDISLTGGTLGARIMNWGIAWGAIKERPLLGYGQGNYGVIFDKNYDPRLWSQENWFDRSHSLIFDLLIAGGFLALFSYAAILLSVIYYIWKKSSGFLNSEKAVLTAFFAAYFIHTSVVFDSLTSYMLLFIIIALVHSRVGVEFKIFEKINFSEKMTAFLLVVVALATPYTVWAVNANSFLQNRELIEAIRPRKLSDLNINYENFKSSLSRNDLGQQETLLQLVLYAIRLLGEEGVPNELKQKFTELVYTEFNKYIENNPTDARVYSTVGQYFAQVGNFEYANKLLDESILLAPKKQFIYKPKIEILLLEGKIDEGFELAKKVYEINKDNDDFWNFYIKIVIMGGDKQLYTKMIEDAFVEGKSHRVVNIMEQTFKESNYQSYINLAVAYYRSGQSEKSVEVLEELKTRFPNLAPQAETYIKKIKANEELILKI